MNEQIPWNKLSRYIADKCTPREKQAIQKWIEADPQREELVRELKLIWGRSKKNGHNWDIDTAWQKVSLKLDKQDRQQAIHLVELSSGKKGKKNSYLRNRKHNNKLPVAIFAAVAAVALIVGLFYYPVQHQEAEKQKVMQKVETHKGQISRLMLSDGTRVWLNADSRLKIPGHFDGDVREVFLEGEAFFKVAPNKEKPFIVHAGGSVTRVLGTRFNVRAYPREEEIEVVVEEGKVSFGSDEEPIHQALQLESRQMGTLSENQQPAIHDVEHLGSYTGRIRGKLIFRDTPLAEAVIELERWYDINCIIADSVLNHRTITASFKDEPQSEVLSVISLSVGMNYDRHSGGITFYAK